MARLLPRPEDAARARGIGTRGALVCAFRAMAEARLRRLRGLLSARTPWKAPRRPGLGEAAVAILVRPTADPELLLIKRAEHAHDPWSGHIALPGGRRGPLDSDLKATALRETAEETGIRVERVGELWGALDEVAPASKRLPPIVIAPFVALVARGTRAVPSPGEVQEAFWVPFSVLKDEEAIGELLLDLGEEMLAFPTIRFRQHEIWGLTHRILKDFLDLAGRAGF